jgi:hypothetical protein
MSLGKPKVATWLEIFVLDLHTSGCGTGEILLGFFDDLFSGDCNRAVTGMLDAVLNVFRGVYSVGIQRTATILSF